jgi:hypothetical protein
MVLIPARRGYTQEFVSDCAPPLGGVVHSEIIPEWPFALIQRRDVRVVEAARLEIDSCRAQ